MEIWLDAQLSPQLASWIEQTFTISCKPLKELGRRDATDNAIFQNAKEALDVVIMTKDEDFVELQSRLKAPPKIIWLTIGNCSNEKMKAILSTHLPNALTLLQQNNLVEIGR